MNNKLTPQQYQQLSTYEDLLQKAAKNNYNRSIPRPTLNTLYALYKEITGTKKSYNLSCSSCVRQILQTLTQAYFNHISEKEKQTEEEETQGNPQQSQQHENQNTSENPQISKP